MKTIQDVEAAFRQWAGSSPVELNSSTLNFDSFALLLSLLEIQRLSFDLTADGISRTNGKLAVNGRSTLFGAATDLELAFEVGANGQIECALAATIPSLTLASLPGYGLVPTKNLSAIILPDQPFADVKLSAQSKPALLSMSADEGIDSFAIMDEAGLTLNDVGFTLDRSVQSIGQQKNVALTLRGKVKIGILGLRDSSFKLTGDFQNPSSTRAKPRNCFPTTSDSSPITITFLMRAARRATSRFSLK